LWLRNIPVEGEECRWIYERSLPDCACNSGYNFGSILFVH